MADFDYTPPRGIWFERRHFRFALGESGFTLLIRRGGEPWAGLRIKRKSEMMFSEREGGWWGFCLGPLYVRTFSRRPIPRLTRQSRP